MAYEYEVFVSYRRAAPVGDWVHDHFKPLLVEWLEVATPLQTRVYVDDQLETGVTWPLELRRTLQRSCFLVPVWSPKYFSSPWCLAELHTMLARERRLEMRSAANPNGLIFPVRFNDGEHFPEDILAIQDLDLRGLNIPGQAFKRTESYVALVQKVQAFTEMLAAKLASVPDWEENWPVETPDGGGRVQVSLPRL
jgi:TIR domain